MAEFLRLLVSLSLSGAALTALGWGLNALLRRRAPRWVCYYLWLVVLARFLFPFASGQSLLGRAMAAPPPEEGWVVQTQDMGEALTAPQAHPSQNASGGEDVTLVLAGLWLTGAAAVLAVRSLGYAGLCRQLGKQAEPAQPWERELCTRLGPRGRAPALLRCPAAPSPVLVGVLRPKIYLPADPIPAPQLTHALRHELTHYRRGDLVYKWGVTAAVSLHWFNPAVWLVSRWVERDCELSCDEAVVGSLGREDRLSYGRALLWAAGRGTGAPELSAPFLSQKQCLKERLNAIMKPNLHTRGALGLAAGAAAILLAASVALGAYAGQESSVPDALLGSRGSTQAGEMTQLPAPAPQLAWPFEAGEEVRISNPFGTRVHPVTGRTSSHSGVDFPLAQGTAVLAAAQGTVEETGFDAVLGNYVLLRHGGGLTTLYAQLEDCTVTEGQQVAQGEQVGTAGMTGQATGCHLHFEAALEGEPADPLELLPAGELETAGE